MSRTDFNENLDWMEFLHRTKAIHEFIKRLSANDYNALPLSTKQAIELLYDYSKKEK